MLHFIDMLTVYTESLVWTFPLACWCGKLHVFICLFISVFAHMHISLCACEHMHAMPRTWNSDNSDGHLSPSTWVLGVEII